MSTVTIIPVGNRDKAVTASLDEGDTLTGGAGGWEVLDRPRQSPAVYWRGTPGREYVLPLVLDGLAREQSVEPDIAALRAMATPTTRKGTTAAPPVVRLVGPLQVSAESRWVIQDLEWGPYDRGETGQIVRQSCTVKLIEYAAAAPVTSHAAKARNKQGGKGSGGKPPPKKGKQG